MKNQLAFVIAVALVLGACDNGTISGLKFPEDEEFVLSRAIRELAKPAISFEVTFLSM